ncbi:ABC transporter substrate-binding protein [Streptomyces synnematoformans]|uniref:ABC transporter substrate-binding protein n=1 Tax=Streptomyces synnematoformans TaxID=415721 RepID=A0ABN2XQ86_9ACTN
MDLGTFVSRTQAPFHTGSGDQHIYIAAMAEASQRLGTHGKDPRSLAEEQLAFAYQRFVPPRRLGEARRLLHEHRIAVIAGAPGSGRHTAAQMLLYEPTAGIGIHEVDPEDGEAGGLTLDRQAVADGDRLLLDLSDCQTTRFAGLQSELSAFRAVVEERGARLVVVLSPHLDELLTAELRRLTVRLHRPRADHVLMRHLRRAHITPPPTALTAPALTHFLADAPMRDIARLAEGVRRARDDVPAGTFDDWWPDELAQLREDDPEGIEFVDKLTDGRQRALALTVAMLHGSAPDTIYHAVTALLQELKHPEDERPRLDRADLNTELTKLDCPAGRGGRVRFTEPGRVRTVLAHFWSYFPDLRPTFRTWVAHCVRNLRLDRDERDRVIERFAAQALRTGQPEELVSLAREWTADGKQELMPDAAQALAAGVRHDVHGRAVREWILADVRQRDLPRTYRLALTVVCSQVMAVGHPDQALVRLHHLARAEDDRDGPPALTALLSLATSDRRLCVLLLTRLTSYGIRPTGFRSASESRIFLALADAAAGRPALCTDHVARRRLTECWATVFAYGAHEEWTPHVRTWLSAAGAAEYRAHRDALLTTLAAAAAPYPAAAGRTFVVSQRWALAPGDDRAQRRDTAEHYRRSLGAAQGIGPAPEAPPSGAPPSETPPSEAPPPADPDVTPEAP